MEKSNQPQGTSKITLLLRTFIAVIIQLFLIYLFRQSRSDFTDLSFERFKNLNFELKLFLKIIAFLFFQIFLLFEFLKIGLLYLIRYQAFRQIRKEYRLQLIEKYSKDQNHLNKIEAEEMSKINKILLANNDQINNKNKEIEIQNQTIKNSTKIIQSQDNQIKALQQTIANKTKTIENKIKTIETLKTTNDHQTNDEKQLKTTNKKPTKKPKSSSRQ